MGLVGWCSEGEGPAGAGSQLPSAEWSGPQGKPEVARVRSG